MVGGVKVRALDAGLFLASASLMIFGITWVIQNM